MFNFIRRKVKIVNQILQQQKKIYQQILDVIAECPKSLFKQIFFCSNCEIFKLECMPCHEQNQHECPDHQPINIKKFIEEQTNEYNNIIQMFVDVENKIEEQSKFKFGQKVIKEITDIHDQNTKSLNFIKESCQANAKNYLTKLQSIKIEEKLIDERNTYQKQLSEVSQIYPFVFNPTNQSNFQKKLIEAISQIQSQIKDFKNLKALDQSKHRQFYCQFLIKNINQKLQINPNDEYSQLISYSQLKQLRETERNKFAKVVHESDVRINQLISILDIQKNKNNDLVLINTNKQIKIKQLQQRIDGLIQQNKVTKNEINKNIKILSEFQQQNIKSQNKIAQIQQKYNNQKLNHKIQQNLQKYQENNNQKQANELISIKLQKELIKKQSVKLKKQLDKTIHQLQSIKQECVVHKTQITNLKNKITELQNQCKHQKNHKLLEIQKHQQQIIHSEQKYQKQLNGIQKHTQNQLKNTIIQDQHFQLINKHLIIQESLKITQLENQLKKQIEIRTKISTQYNQKQKYLTNQTEEIKKIIEIQNKTIELLKKQLVDAQNDEIKQKQKNCPPQNIFQEDRIKKYQKQLLLFYSFSTQMIQKQDKVWLLDKIKSIQNCIQFNLIYVASKHDFKADVFHKNCDQKQNLLVLIKCMSTNNEKPIVIGGFTKYKLGELSSQHTAFIFSVTERQVMHLKKEKKKATLKDEAYGPIFGENSDIQVYKNTVFSNYHILNTSYEKISNKGYLLVGSKQKVIIEDYEVYQLK